MVRARARKNQSPQKIRQPKQAGKNWGSLRGKIFARLLSAKGGMGQESISVIPAIAGTQNRKIFFSLIEKNLQGGGLKNVEEIFLFCSPKRSGGDCGNACPSGARANQIKFQRPDFVGKKF